MKIKMRVVKVKPPRRPPRWWIEGVPPYEVDGLWYQRYGPYETYREARETVQRVKDTLLDLNEC